MKAHTPKLELPPAPGLYIHIPFCRSKCPYCAFYSIASSSLIPRWLEAFKQEVISCKGRFERFDSLYVGGGTPTFLEHRELACMMEHVFTHFEFDPHSEITIEANPCDLTRGKIYALKGMGFNRISVGVQSFDDHILAFLGRKHTAKEAERALTDLRSLGFENIGVDLIYGFEEQSLEKWIDTLKQAVAFQPEHLSCYQLTIEKQTLFGHMKDQGLFQPLDEEQECSYFLTTSHFLEDHGYIHYEISSFARDEGCYSWHNRKYWHHVPYLGLGPSAHSFDGSDRWWNVRSIRKYCEALKGRRPPVEGYEKLTDEQLRLESISLGLRTEQGFDLKKIPPNPELTGVLAALQAAGFLHVNDGRVIPTKKGFLVADGLAVQLTSCT